MGKQNLCTENPYICNLLETTNGDANIPADIEMEYQRLTILTFPQSSLIQSMALSHREFAPVSMFEGVKVSIEYIESDAAKWISEPSHARGIHSYSDLSDDHSKHLQCYRSSRGLKEKGSSSSTNGVMLR